MIAHGRAQRHALHGLGHAFIVLAFEILGSRPIRISHSKRGVLFFHHLLLLLLGKWGGALDSEKRQQNIIWGHRFL